MKKPLEKLIELLQNPEFNKDQDPTSQGVLRTLIEYYHQSTMNVPFNEHQLGVINRTYYRRIESKKKLVNPFFKEQENENV